MPTYVIFIRKHTKVPAELEIYSQKAPASLAGRPVKVNALYGRHELIEENKSKRCHSRISFL